MTDITGPGPIRLRVTGLVDGPRVLDQADLRSLAPGGDSGQVPSVGVGAVLNLCRPDPTASHVTVVSEDESYTASIPLPDVVQGILQVGEDVPGGPIRLIVENGRTACWNVKTVGELRLTDRPVPDSVPENPPH